MCALIEGWLASAVLLGDDFLEFLWLDPFLLVLRQSTFVARVASDSIDFYDYSSLD